MLRLRSIQIEGFRGFPKKSEILEFSTPAILVWGDNHQGKSSLLNSIEWCLYGDQCIGEKSGIRERVGGWEVINRNASAARVKLAVETNQGVATIERVEVKGKGKKGKQILVCLPDGTKKESTEAEQEITQLVGLSFRDFSTMVYQHQETIRDIVIQKPADRNEAIDRLLGLSDYRNILDGIKRSKIVDTQKALVGQLNEFQDSVKQALSYRLSDMESKKTKAVDSGLVEADLNESKLLQSTAEILKQLEQFSADLGIPATHIFLPSRWIDVHQFMDTVKKELDRLWGESPDVMEQSVLNSRRSLADRIKTDYDSSKKTYADAKDKVDALDRDRGNLLKIQNQIQEIEANIANIDNEIARVSPKAKLVREAIDLLASATSSISMGETCPLCGQGTPNLLGHLQKEWSERIEKSVNDLNSRQVDLKNQKAESERVKLEYVSGTQKLESAIGGLNAVIKRAAEFLGRQLTDQEDPAALLSNETERINARLTTIETAITEKRVTLGKIADAVTRAGLVYEILENEEKISSIQEISESNEYKEVEDLRDKIAAFVTDAEVVEHYVRECMSEEAKGRIGTAATAIDNYFRKITANPAIQKLDVKIEEDKKSGSNSYIFCDQNGDELNPVLSQGDLNSLALSMFLGLVKAYAHPIDFILMDDPSQSLGPTQKARLVEVLDEVCQGGRSIVLGIMDTELQKVLESKLTRAKTIYEVSNWTPDSGPNISKRI